ncbi:unnamed protein product [Peronospora destructor]|uniref:Uncharacterized protein n=1 Tax=Peronospora destructor TaxID=86335 RepID=A0AAV0VDA1_9STRA|nr:unnamed protein product [Peronospora destructor]
MGGNTSRMVREIVEDSLYIIRQTNHATYQRSRNAHDEVQMKLMELRQLKEEMLQSTESDTQRSRVFESFQKTVGKQKQELEKQVDGFVQQFELPKSYQKITDVHRQEISVAKHNKTQEAAKALEKPQETPH